MVRFGITYAEAVAKATALKEIGEETIYLHGETPAAYPWPHVTDVEPGGSHRLECDTSVRFIASDPCGLRFSWSIELEQRSANGQGHYEVDTATILLVRQLLPPLALAKYDAYLGDCARKIKKHADEYLAWMEREYGVVAVLDRLIQSNPRREPPASKEDA